MSRLGNIFNLLLILGIVFAGVSAWGQANPPQALGANCELVVLANSADPYYSLALEIAAAEGAPIVNDISEALACQPVYLLWVASPGWLTEAALVEYGLAMQEQPGAISTGILTASTLEGARQLWQRGSNVGGGHFIAANAANPSAHIDEGRILDISTGGSETTRALTKNDFLAALQSADYLTFTGHGGKNFLGLSKSEKITPADIPGLGEVLIATGSCQTFRPWEAESIALRFIDQGAAAYAGFVFSPNEGYLIGEFDGLPFRYTWPEFPIGHVIQAQNQGTLQGFASFPFLFLLGNPRLALQSQPPYEVLADEQTEGRRILKLRNVPAGVTPIRIEGGAGYGFIHIPGVSSAAEGDPFYNSRLQMVDIHGDKYLLVISPGGELTLELSRIPPWYWYPQDVLLDSLDSVLIFNLQSGGEQIALLLTLPLLGWVAWMLFKRRLQGKKARLAILIGMGTTVLHGLYIYIRLDQVTMISKTLVFNPLGLLSTFLLVTIGALIYFHSTGWVGKVIAIGVVSFSFWSPLVFGLAILGLANILALNSAIGVGLYNYSLALLPGASLPGIIGLSGLVLWLVGRTVPGGSVPKVC